MLFIFGGAANVEKHMRKMRCKGMANVVVHLSRRYAKRQLVNFVTMMTVCCQKIETPRKKFYRKRNCLLYTSPSPRDTERS
eukprot:5485749-Karenia_brevis.AAC.1